MPAAGRARSLSQDDLPAQNSLRLVAYSRQHQLNPARRRKERSGVAVKGQRAGSVMVTGRRRPRTGGECFAAIIPKHGVSKVERVQANRVSVEGHFELGADRLTGPCCGDRDLTTVACLGPHTRGSDRRLAVA